MTTSFSKKTLFLFAAPLLMRGPSVDVSFKMSAPAECIWKFYAGRCRLTTSSWQIWTNSKHNYCHRWSDSSSTCSPALVLQSAGHCRLQVAIQDYKHYWLRMVGTEGVFSWGKVVPTPTKIHSYNLIQDQGWGVLKTPTEVYWAGWINSSFLTTLRIKCEPSQLKTAQFGTQYLIWEEQMVSWEISYLGLIVL